LRAEGEDPDPSARSKAANELDAACCVSLHCHADAELAGGATCASFGTRTTHSPAGERLAREILSGVSERAGLEARGTRRLAVAILRETWMPAVVVELGLLADAEGERRAGDPEARAAIARGVADGIERFLGAPPAEQLLPDEPA
jgi:N-acetylmuramoyl-L-alanine amidase